MNDNFDVSVIVVGGGPVGLALAGDLGFRGVSCLLVEQGNGHVEQPKMDLVGVRTMEFCRRWGLVAAVHNSPYPRDYKQDFVYCTSVSGHELGREDIPAMADTVPAPYSPQSRERCPQDMFDPILRDFAASFPHVELRYQTRFESVIEHDGGVECVLVDARTGKPGTVRAKYLVGCDGVGSSVRKGLGIAMQGEATLTCSLNVMFRSPEFNALHDKGPAYRYVLVGAEGIWATLVAINGRDNWRLQIVGDENPRDTSLSAVRADIERAFGKAFPYEVLSVVPWTRRELVAESYGRGRVLLAGDAVHAMSPTGGFGMNTGIADAVDLSWKLDGILSGWADPGILATYEIERRPVGVRAVTEAANNIRRMRAYRPPDRLMVSGAEGARVRAKAGQEIAEMMRKEWFGIGIHIGFSYDGSPIVVPDGTPAEQFRLNDFVQSARPGGRAPHAWLADGSSLLDLYGQGFVLLRTSSAADRGFALLDAARAVGLPLRIETVDEPGIRDLHDADLVLIRPDGHVAWRGLQLPDDCTALVDTVRGARVAMRTTAAASQHPIEAGHG